MKPSQKALIAAAALSAAISLTSCGGESSSDNSKTKPDSPSSVYDPSSEEVQNVYGPPPTTSEPVKTEN